MIKCFQIFFKFAFNIYLRRYTVAVAVLRSSEVGRCRLPVSQPELKAYLVSVLETKMWCTAFKLCFQFQLAQLHRGFHRDCNQLLRVRRRMRLGRRPEVRQCRLTLSNPSSNRLGLSS